MISEKYRFVIKLLFTVIILFFIIQLLDYNKLIFALSIAKKEFLIFVFLSVPIWIWLKSLKWKILLSSFYPETSNLLACRSFLGGLGPGLFTPGKIGEFTRTFYLPYGDNFKIISLVILDRYCDFIVLLLLCGIGISHFFGVYYGIAIVITAIFGISLFYIFPIIIKNIRIRVGRKGESYKKLFFKFENISKIKPLIFHKSLLLSLIIFLLSIFASFLILNSFETTQLSIVYKVFPITLLTNILPITIGNLGVREGATILLLQEYGIESEIAFNTAIILFFTHSLLPAIIGLFISKHYIEKNNFQFKVVKRNQLKKNLLLNAVYQNFKKEILKYISSHGTKPILEIGSSDHSLLRDTIPNVITSDIIPDEKNDICCSAELLPFDNKSLYGIVMCNVLHHIKNPRKFFNEAQRVLVENGKIVMIEPSMTFFGKWIRKLFHHENLDVKAFWEIPGDDPIMDANLANPWIIFKRDIKIFREEFPGLELIEYYSHTPLMYLLSGGANRKSIVPGGFLKLIIFIEKLISPLNEIFGYSATIVVKRIKK